VTIGMVIVLFPIAEEIKAVVLDEVVELAAKGAVDVMVTLSVEL